MFKPVIFREYDIRGVYKEHFDEDFAFLLGKAHATFVKKQMKSDKKMLLTVGHDARLSSPSLAKAASEGMMSAGADVYMLGLVTTPISYYSTFALKGVDGALMITGSHNPPEYNGFKISVGTGTIYGSKIMELKTIIDQKAFAEGQGTAKTYDIFPEYIERYKKEFAGLKALPVVLDGGNGAAGCIVRRLYEACGLKPVILFEEPDGEFPNHHPDPTVEENLQDLIAKVKETKSALGIGFDGDADRIGVVDSAGKILYGDEFMTIVARDLLAKEKGLKIIGDVKCSDRMYDDVAKRGGVPIMWKTGHSLIKQKIKDEKAPFGGELSGHIFFNDRNYGYDDSLYAGLRLIEILSKSGKTIQQLLEGLPPAFNTPELRIDTTEEKKVSIVEALRKKYAKDTADYKVNLTDGIRISYRDGWALARSSNTQPVLVLRFESSTESGLNRIRNEIESVIKPLL
jgi:phosphomannomutase